MKPRVIIEEFDLFLSQNALSFQGVVIGATALALLGAISRETKDCDVLDPEIPKSIKEAAKQFALMKRNEDERLEENWLNNGPESLKVNLPKGWLKRSVSLFSGKALSLRTLGRSDLLKTKLLAYCDRQSDAEDCIAMKPTQDELREAIDWVKYQDANSDWPKHVVISFSKLAKKLGYGL